MALYAKISLDVPYDDLGHLISALPVRTRKYLLKLLSASFNLEIVNSNGEIKQRLRKGYRLLASPKSSQQMTIENLSE